MTDYEAAAKAATLEELKAFHAKYYGPAHMTLVVVGDVAAAEAQAEVGRAFAGWSGGQDYVRPGGSRLAAGGTRNIRDSGGQAERLGHHRSADGAALQGSRRVAAARRARQFSAAVSPVD